MQSLPLMLRRKHFFSFEQFYVTGTGRVGSEVTMCYDYSFSILNVLQREVKKNVLTNLQYLKEFCSFQARCQDLFYLKKNFLSEELNMLSLKSSRKKKKKATLRKTQKGAENVFSNSAFLWEPTVSHPMTWCFSELEPSCHNDYMAQRIALLQYYVSKG